MQKRSDYIDVMRGIGIFSVVFVHIARPNNNPELILWIQSFYMPLFFFISGMVHKGSVGFVDFTKKKFKTIMIPYFFWAVLCFLYWALLERRFRAAESQIDILDGLLGIVDGRYEHLVFNVVLWFLPVLFLVSVLFHLLLQIEISDSKKNLAVFGSLIGLSCLGIILFEESWVWGLNKVFKYILFYGLGYYIRDYKIDEKIMKMKNCKLFSLVGIVAFGFISFIMNEKGLRDAVWFYLIAIVGITIVFFVSILTEKLALFKVIGQNTMGILVMHGPLYRILCVAVAYLTNLSVAELRENYWFALVLSFVTIGLIFIPIKILRKILPWCLGVKQKKI